MKVFALISMFVAFQLAPAPFELEYAPAPGSPFNITALSAVVLTADVSQQGIPANIQTFYGGPPFDGPAVRSVTGWRFRNDTKIDRPVSVTFLFRTPTTYPGDPIPIPPPQDERNVQRDLPPIPVVVFDPGYPPSSIAEGPVVLQIDVSAAGTPQQIRVIGAGNALSELSTRAATQWRFLPAVRNGRNVEGTAIAVIAFLRPVVAE